MSRCLLYQALVWGEPMPAEVRPTSKGLQSTRAQTCSACEPATQPWQHAWRSAGELRPPPSAFQHITVKGTDQDTYPNTRSPSNRALRRCSLIATLTRHQGRKETQSIQMIKTNIRTRAYKKFESCIYNINFKNLVPHCSYLMLYFVYYNIKNILLHMS